MSLTIADDSAGPGDGGGPPDRPRRYWSTLLAVLVLITVPLGYLVISAQQSRESGAHKQRIAAADGLIEQWPTRVQRRIYDIPVPPDATEVRHYETNSWEESSLFVEFATVPEDLTSFMRWVGTDRSALRDGTVTITEEQARTVGWQLCPKDRSCAGTIHRKPENGPDLAITVDLTDRAAPRVYVVSTLRF